MCQLYMYSDSSFFWDVFESVQVQSFCQTKGLEYILHSSSDPVLEGDVNNNQKLPTLPTYQHEMSDCFSQSLEGWFNSKIVDLKNSTMTHTNYSNSR